VTPGPGQPPALTPARQPLTWGTLSPPRYKCWQGERKNPVLARTLQRSKCFFRRSKIPSQEIKVFHLYVMLLSARLKNLTGSTGRMFFLVWFYFLKFSFFVFAAVIKIPTRIQCCGSGMFIPDPNFFPGSIRFPDPGSGSGSASKNLSILTQKIVSTLSKI
jgi:hypothetical protein